MFIFLDTETTGIGPENRLCQIAYKPEVGPAVSELFNPGMPISIEAMAIHHITNKMVQDKPSFQGSEAHENLRKLVSDQHNIIVAHNARFDMEMLNREDIHPQKVICTLKLARYLDAGGVIRKYNLQYLRYYLGLEIDATPHDALGDILVLEGVFKRIYAKFVANGLRNRINDRLGPGRRHGLCRPPAHCMNQRCCSRCSRRHNHPFV